MSRKGNCWNNTLADSFCVALKKEGIFGQALKPITAVLAQVFECTERDYHRMRRDSNNGWLSPVQAQLPSSLRSQDGLAI